MVILGTIGIFAEYISLYAMSWISKERRCSKSRTAPTQTGATERQIKNIPKQMRSLMLKRFCLGSLISALILVLLILNHRLPFYQEMGGNTYFPFSDRGFFCFLLCCKWNFVDSIGAAIRKITKLSCIEECCL